MSDTKQIATHGTLRVAVLETEVFGVKAWHFKCLTCGMQSARQSPQRKVEAAAKAHRCTRWGSN